MNHHVRIRYCPRCGWLLRAAWMAQELLTSLGDELAEVSLCPAGAGVFEIVVDGECLWSRREQGGFPEIKALKRLVRDAVAPDRDLGHTDRGDD
ncbi:hypothetical protein KBTX_02421 [wastewater metagenome]|uniref:Selenoprotein W-related protein n=2 Tax=unclassified sequences TaxID=12908 RepID=A0A5B8REY8_9ZZZZ|nr:MULTISPECIES: SelT/SelW/SelH family protein [Arhodomonas]MCS4505425.1 SelT/SelW/SelH family protein [Arhodomonas aquaeolei]QEA06092.1 hypothetical protein KBTEX_02421 [uncultured organism]